METPAQPPPPPINTTNTTTTTWDSLIPAPKTALSLLSQSIHNRQIQPKFFPTGCPDLDSNVLLGGFNAGSVVGISSEDEDFALTLALQTISLALLLPRGAGGEEKTALIVTTLPVQSLLPRLRTVLVEQLAKVVSFNNLQTWTKECLSRISISRVFDTHGLAEVLDELSLQRRKDTKGPDLVLMMNMTALISNLFTSKSHDKAAAHNFVTNLAARLDKMTQTGEYGTSGPGPLVMLLNSTTSYNNDNTLAETGEERKLDGGMTSTFYVPEVQSRDGEGIQQGGRGNKNRKEIRPAWGQVFGRLVGVHLLCTTAGRDVGRKGWVVEVLGDEVGVYTSETTVVEEGDDRNGGGDEVIWTRRNREQRWGVVELRNGAVVDVVF
ncbi:hypothetical protein QBC36DRAFT_291260 [Triangularia setosa]|uniref:Uncharacterized protein n=1 Tax=Triangularia setosa TaxID=2587417 RepID=A0AAN6W8W5_9PEZI|nr:hypothetical protein QBC36DRAFT_291260 [Podospora setosa]